MESAQNHSKRVEELKKQIDDLKKRWPAHSVPPAMMAQLDELEDELGRELKKADGSTEAKESGP